MKLILFWYVSHTLREKGKKVEVATYAQKMYVIFPYHYKIIFLEKEIEKKQKRATRAPWKVVSNTYMYVYIYVLFRRCICVSLWRRDLLVS